MPYDRRHAIIQKYVSKRSSFPSACLSLAVRPPASCLTPFPIPIPLKTNFVITYSLHCTQARQSGPGPRFSLDLSSIVTIVGTNPELFETTKACLTKQCILKMPLSRPTYLPTAVENHNSCVRVHTHLISYAATAAGPECSLVSCGKPCLHLWAKRGRINAPLLTPAGGLSRWTAATVAASEL